MDGGLGMKFKGTIYSDFAIVHFSLESLLRGNCELT